MSLISVTAIQDGVTGVTAASVNNPINTIVNDYNGGITDANVSASAAITFNKISGGSTTALAAWATWSPSLTNLSGGAVTYAKYVQIGKTVFFRFRYVLGGAGISGTPSISMPTSLNAGYSAADIVDAEVQLQDATGNYYTGKAIVASSTTIALYAQTSGSAHSFLEAVSSTVPFTWANTDIITVVGTYEVA